MSTRGIIARVGKEERSFRGVYNHSDSYPTWMGPLIWRILRQQYSGAVERFLKEMIDAHPCGWSQFGEICYCHGPERRNEPEMVFTHEDFAHDDDGGAEWLWVLDPENQRLFVRDLNYHEDLAPIDLGGPEPDWQVFECGETFERCRHYAGAHLPEMKDSRIGMQTYLGKVPFDFRDAIAVIIGGKRYQLTGGGGDAAYMTRYGGRISQQLLPAGTWMSAVMAANGRGANLPTAIQKDGKFTPFSGVTWVFPPIKDIPHETLFSG